MKKLLSIIVLGCAMMLAAGAFAPGARAAVLSSDVLALKKAPTGISEQARYGCWWRNGYRHCGWRPGWRRHWGGGYGWRHHRYGWRHRYWRRPYGYGYYRPYRRPYYRPYQYRTYRPYHYYGYHNCIGICW